MTSKYHVRKAVAADKELIKFLYAENFKEDPKAYVDFYFKEEYNPETTYILEEEGSLLSVLQLREKTIVLNGLEVKTNLIAAVVTPKEHRRKGYMEVLLNNVLDMIDQKFEITLIQAYNWEVYKKFGFVNSHFLNTWEVKLPLTTPSKLIDVEANHLLKLYETMTDGVDGYQVRDLDYFTKDLEISKELSIKHVASKDAYIKIDGDMIVDFAAESEKDLHELLSTLKGDFKINLPTDINLSFENATLKERKLFVQWRGKNGNIPRTENNLYFNEYI